MLIALHWRFWIEDFEPIQPEPTQVARYGTQRRLRALGDLAVGTPLAAQSLDQLALLGAERTTQPFRARAPVTKPRRAFFPITGQQLVNRSAGNARRCGSSSG